MRNLGFPIWTTPSSSGHPRRKPSLLNSVGSLWSSAYALSFKTESLSWPDGLVCRSLFISVCSIGLQSCFRENLIYGRMLLSLYSKFEDAGMTRDLGLVMTQNRDHGNAARRIRPAAQTGLRS